MSAPFGQIAVSEVSGEKTVNQLSVVSGSVVIGEWGKDRRQKTDDG